jgi:hypothetical protein
LDAYCPSGNPTVAAVKDGGNNNIVNSLEVWVGLHNTTTGHYSNGVFAGSIDTPITTATVTVSDLQNLKYAFHDNNEKNELKYVFYSSLDGGKVPYLVLNAAGTDVLTAAITATEQSLSLIAAETDGFYRDVTAEMPIDNFPPRPMSNVVSVQGRVYGSLMSGGSGDKVLQTYPDGSKKGDFKYDPGSRDTAAVCYSKAAEDIAQQHTVGAHEEAWPLLNIKATENGEVPTLLEKSPDGYRLVVLCPTASFLLSENNIGLHEWTTISDLHGIYNKACAAVTKYGLAWVTQRNQLVLLKPFEENVETLSDTYQSLFDGKTPRWVAYWLDPLNEVDQIHVYFTDGTGVVHDFAVGGEPYTFTNNDFRCGATVIATTGKVQHVLANQHLWTHLGQQSPVTDPNDGKIYTQDVTYSGSDMTLTTSVSGEYISQWMDFDDDSQRKEFTHVDLLCDRNTRVQWYADLEEIASGNIKGTQSSKRPQSQTDETRRFKLQESSKFWYKIKIKLTGDDTQDYYSRPSEQGDLARNFYGVICRALRTVVGRGNRP